VVSNQPQERFRTLDSYKSLWSKLDPWHEKLLAKAHPAKSVICPGCERGCIMPVRMLTRANDAAVSFVVCDKRADINRVPICSNLLKQWRSDAEAVREFLNRQRPFGQSNWQEEVARKFGLGS
jgi:hypothetical protein